MKKLGNPKVDIQVVWKQEWNNEFIDVIRNSIDENAWTDALVGGTQNKPAGKLDKILGR